MTMSSDIDATLYKEALEVSVFQQKLQEQRKRYIKNKLCHDILMNMIEQGLFDTNLSEKIKDTLIYQDVLEGVSLVDSEMLTVLGLKTDLLIPTELSFEEQCKLRNLIQFKLDTKIHHKIVKELKEKLNNKQQEDIENLTQIRIDLEKMIKLRTEELAKIVAKKMEEYELKMKIMHAKYKVLNYRLKLSVFTEVDKCFQIYQELISDIEKQQEACKRNIEMLTLKKEKYAVVRSKEYDNILEAYLQYKSLVQEKITLLDKLKN